MSNGAEKINEYVNRPEVAEDTKFMLEQFKLVIDGYKEVNKLRVALGKSFSGSTTKTGSKPEVDGVTAMLKEFDKLEKKRKTLLDVDLAAHKEQLRRDAEALKAKQRLTSAEGDAAKATAKSKEEERKRTAEVRLQVKEEAAAVGSLDQKRAILARLQKEYAALDSVQRNSVGGQAILLETKALSDEVKSLEASFGDNRRNVGNYGEALKDLEGYLRDVQQAIKATKQASGGISLTAPTNPAGGAVRSSGSAPRALEAGTRETVKYAQATAQATVKVRELEKEEELLSRLLNNQVTGYASATQQVKAQEKALQELEKTLGNQHPAFLALLKDTAELKDRVGDLKDEIKALSSDTRSIDLIVGAISGLTSIIQTAVGTYELFGGTNEDVQKSIQRLAALTNIANGVQSFSNELTTKGTALNKLYNLLTVDRVKATVASTVATEGQAVATTAASAATKGLSTGMKVLNATLVTSALGILVAGIGYLIGQLDNWKEEAKRVNEINIQLNETLLEQRNLARDIASLTNNDIGTGSRKLENDLILAQAYGKSQEDILKKELELIKVAKDNSTLFFTDTRGLAALDELGSKLESLRYKLLALNNAKNQEISGLAVENFDKEKQKIEENYEVQKKAIESELALVKDQYQDQKVIVDDYYANNRLFALKEAELLKLLSDNRRRDAAAELEIFKIRATAHKDFQDLISSAEGFGLATRINARKSALNDEIAIIEKTRAFELSEAKETNASVTQIKLINVRANDDIRRAKEKHYDDLLGIQASFLARQREQEKADADLAKDIVDVDLDAIQEARFRKRKSLLEEGRDIVIRSIEEERQAKLSAASTDEERAKIEAFYNDKRARKEQETNIAIQKTALELAEWKLKNVTNLKDEDRAGLEAEIANLKLLITELGRIPIDLDTDKAKAKIAELSDAINTSVELIGAGFAALGGILENSLQPQEADIEKQLSDIEERKNKEIEAAEQSGASEVEKTRRKAEAEQRAAGQREIQEKRQRQLDVDRARFQKAANIAQAIGTGANAVLRGLEIGGPVLAAIYGAIAAVQIFNAIAAPLPKFKTGRKPGQKGTLGVVGDGKRNEVIYSPDFKDVTVTPATDTVAYIKDGYGIASSVDEFNNLALKATGKKMSIAQPGNYDFNIMAVISSGFDAMAKAESNKIVQHVNITEDGITKLIENGINKYFYAQRNM